jgi:hypothetical protein
MSRIACEREVLLCSLSNYPGLCIKTIRKTVESLVQNNRSPSLDLNSGNSDYKPRLQPIRRRCLFQQFSNIVVRTILHLRSAVFWTAFTPGHQSYQYDNRTKCLIQKDACGVLKYRIGKVRHIYFTKYVNITEWHLLCLEYKNRIVFGFEPFRSWCT